MRLLIFLFLFWTVLSSVVLTIIVVTSKYVARLFEPHSVLPQIVEDTPYPSTLTFTIAIGLGIIVAVSLSRYMSRTFRANMKYHDRVRVNWSILMQSAIWSTATYSATALCSENVSGCFVVGAAPTCAAGCGAACGGAC